jgi:hypothetical protein
MRGLSWQRTLEGLSERDLLILDDLDRFRMLTTRQLQRLRFPVAASADDDGHLTIGAATKAAMRAMSRLREHQVVNALEQRRGGLHAGSQGLIWQLSAKGTQIQQERTGRGSPHRYGEPATMFVQHIIGVADLAITLAELDRAGRLELLEVEAEPINWRTFTGPHLRPVTVKPDLTATIAAGDYEYHWYIELDRSTEHVPKILAKCRTYAAYSATGIEQNERGIFPKVLWVVPDEHRAASLRRAIEQDRELPISLFHVTTADEFPDLMADPPEEEPEDEGT